MHQPEILENPVGERTQPDLPTLLRQMLEVVVDFPDEIRIAEVTARDVRTFLLSVASSDFDTVIGHGGETFRALRILITSMARQRRESCILELVDPEQPLPLCNQKGLSAR